MFKNKNNKKILFLLILNVFVFGNIGFFVNSQAIEINSVWHDIKDRIVNGRELSKINSDVIISDIYKNAMDMVKEKDFQVVDNTVSSTTNSVNKKYGCNMNNNDIMVILSYYDEEILNKMSVVSNQKLGYKKSDVKYACNKLMSCAEQRDSIRPHVECRNIVESFASFTKLNNKIELNFKDNTETKYIYSNGSLEDSDFDLMKDVQTIGEILFEDFEAPVEILNYNFPQWDSRDGSSDDGNNDGESGDGQGNGIKTLGEPKICENGIQQRDPDSGKPKGSSGGDNGDNGDNGDDGDGEGDDGDNGDNGDDSDGRLDDGGDDGGNGDDGDDGGTVSDLGYVIDDVNISENTNQFGGIANMGNKCYEYNNCGNANIDEGEECDDGNKQSGDGCSEFCNLEYCGDGKVQEGLEEKCDDGNDKNNDKCNDCKLTFCGDGITQEKNGYGNKEECDGQEYCNENCEIIFSNSNDNYVHECGNDIKDNGEECDNGDSNADNKYCKSNCKINTCGDGYVWENHEECDDKNNINGDGCSVICMIEDGGYCGDGITQEDLKEECDDGNDNNNDFCTNECKKAVCGDGFINYVGGEECDDGNTDNNDCCSSNCKNEGSLSAEQVYINEVMNEISKLPDDSENIVEELKGCFSDCEKIDAFVDKLNCMIDCACGEYVSNSLPPKKRLKEGEAPILDEGFYRLKFCIVPARSIAINKGKSVYSIQTILKEIKNILKSLRDSGELSKRVETSEFLDTSMKKNKFSDIFSFNIAINFKPLFDKKTDEHYKKLKKKQNDLVSATVAKNSSKKEDIKRNINKYVIMNNIEKDKVKMKPYKDLAQYQQMLINEYELNKPSYPDSRNIENNSENIAKALINESILQYLEHNFSFWKESKEGFLTIYSYAQALKNKIKNY